METRVIWLRQAIDHLDQIATYIAQDSPHNAWRVVADLLDAGDDLKLFPERGHLVEEDSHKRMREIPKHGYRLIYHIRSETVIILGVIHGSRLFPVDEFM
jgi:plasmid stabilization system protein ParE